MADAGVGTIKAQRVCKWELCSGCGACVNICPVQCVKLEEDELGERRAVIDHTHCIGCNMCRKTCPNNGLAEKMKQANPEMVYAGWRKEKTERRKSSSGGIASLLAEYVVQSGGVVYGVCWQEGKAVYQRAGTGKDVSCFRGSKYVQADGTWIYKEIEQDICQRRKVLLTGTPCLIAGVLSYMRQKDPEESYRDYLITVDLLCHGTVPQSYLQEHISAICHRKEIKFDQITFRSNMPGENYRFILKEGETNIYSQRAECDLYFNSFLTSVSIRESCMHCAYKTSNRCGDITLGDFLGLGKKEAFAVDKTGIHPSLVLINSDRGQQLLEKIRERAELYPRTLQEAVDGGPSLRMEGGGISENWAGRRKKFRMLYPRMGFEKAAGKSTGDQIFLAVMKDKMKAVLKR